MKRNQNKTALIMSLLSVGFSLMIWINLFVGIKITSIVYLSDVFQYWSVAITYVFSFIGAVMAILAKRNNVNQKMSVCRISAIGLIISIVDIILFTVIMPIATLTIFWANYFDIQNYLLYIIYILFSIGIAIDIFLIVKYCRTKPKINTK